MYILTENGNIKMCVENTMLLMTEIINKEISNISYFLRHEKNIQETAIYNKLVEEVSNINPKLYNEYIVSVNLNKQITREKIKTAILAIATFIKHGVSLPNGETRKFYPLDCALIKTKYFDNLLRKDITDIINELDKDLKISKIDVDLMSVRKMVSSLNSNNFNDYIPRILKKSILEDDKYGLSISEKKFIIDFFDKNKITYNVENFKDAAYIAKLQRENEDIDIFNISIPVIEYIDVANTLNPVINNTESNDNIRKKTLK